MKPSALYEPGQNVYTARKIRGWYDFSMKDAIPENTLGKIVDYLWVGEESSTAFYVVEFEKEFGRVHLRHHDLKLG